MSTDVVCAVLERISGLEPSSETMELNTVPCGPPNDLFCADATGNVGHHCGLF